MPVSRARPDHSTTNPRNETGINPAQTQTRKTGTIRDHRQRTNNNANRRSDWFIH